MLDFAHALRMRLRTGHIARRQVTLDHCPCCGAPDPEFLFDENNYQYYLFVAPGMRQGKFSLCHRCGVVFAARRSTIETANRFYELFKEGRHDAEEKPGAGAGRAKRMMQILRARGLVRSGLAVLEIRFQSAATLRALRAAMPDAVLHGLDPFDVLVDDAREQGFTVGRLPAGDVCSPFGSHYDLIISYHQLTHAIEPQAFLRKLTSYLKPGGRLVLHGENNHAVLWDPDNKPAKGEFRWSEANRYHLQMFMPRSFEHLLTASGLAYEQVDLGGGKMMMYMAWPSPDLAQPQPVDPGTIETIRTMVTVWQGGLSRYRTARYRWKKTRSYLAQRSADL